MRDSYPRIIPAFKQSRKQSIPSNKGKLASNKAIFRPNSLKTRLQRQSSVSIAPWLGRVTLRETLRYPTPCPFGVSTEADSSNLPASRSIVFILLSLVKDEYRVVSQRTATSQYKALTSPTRTRQRVFAIYSLVSLLTRNFDRCFRIQPKTTGSRDVLRKDLFGLIPADGRDKHSLLWTTTE
jgi:hypothetical protein